MSVVLLLPNTDRSQQVEGLCQKLYYYQILTAVNKLKDYVRGCTLYYYQLLAAVNKLEDYVRGCTTPKY